MSTSDLANGITSKTWTIVSTRFLIKIFIRNSQCHLSIIFLYFTNIFKENPKQLDFI